MNEEEEVEPSSWQGELWKPQRGWLQNTCRRGSAPRLASDNHASNSSSCFLKTSNCDCSHSNKERLAVGENIQRGSKRDGWNRRSLGAKDRKIDGCKAAEKKIRALAGFQITVKASVGPKGRITGYCSGLRNLLEPPGSHSVVAAKGQDILTT